MIKVQPFSTSVLNNSFVNLQNKNVSSNSLNNTLERTPNFDTVTFSGKRPNKDIDGRIVDVIPDEDIEILSDDVLFVEPEDVEEIDDSDNFVEVYDYDQEMNSLKNETEEEDRRQKEQLDAQLNDELLVYGVILPEMMHLSQ